VIEIKKWKGNEIVMDAGCGTGRITKILAEKAGKGGIVYAVDIDDNMIDQAKENLNGFKNVFVIKSNLLNIELPRKVDVIFSNAVLHWILDHGRLFEHFWRLLSDDDTNNKKWKEKEAEAKVESEGGEGLLLAQCGGYGNLSKVLSLINQIKDLGEFKTYFVNWNEPWYFARPEDTQKLLKQIGYKNIEVYLSDGTATFPNRTSYSTFVKNVIIKPFLEYLPNEQIKRRFFKTFLDNVEQSGLDWTLDYLRLNIMAQK
jgi:SAM-dependent methyltransferase